MSIDADKYPFLFSTTTRFAYNIDNDYYGGRHYVWIALRFDDLNSQAASSNPFTIAQDFIRGVSTNDRHCDRINANIAGVLNGAYQMKINGKISAKTRSVIKTKVKEAIFEDFLPLVYIIDTQKVCSRIIEVPPSDVAKTSTPEYKLLDLQEGEYELIDLGEIVKAAKVLRREKVKNNAC